MNKIVNRLAFLIVVLFFTGFSCSNNNPNNLKNSVNSNETIKKRLKLISPSKNQEFKDNSKIVLKVSLIDSSLIPDSINFLLDGRKIGHIKSCSDSIIWYPINVKMGSRSIDAIGYFPGGIKDHDYLHINIRLSAKPVLYSYQVIHVYSHDKNSYTQGLIVDNGFFYESSGLYKQSSLRKVNMTTGEVVKIHNLPSDVFAEGITLFDDKILQISWREQIAFLYDKETFQLINKYYYPIKEGWGITYDGKNLIMSDGSSFLYFLDKEYFTEVSRIQVFDDIGPVEQLNELEYINDEIWANIYTTDTIVKINPKTGGVIGKIDLSGLLKDEDKLPETDVLNGIAYDNQKNRLFVTGKKWPKLFEISVYPKNY